MAQDEQDRLDLLEFELKFLEDGGYGRSPHSPRRPRLAFEDSPSCLNFADPERPHPCNECWLTKFVPDEQKSVALPCRFIPLTDKGETIDHFYKFGTQLQLEEALGRWLRAQISQIKHERAQASQS
jgi:hypothetical protein